MSDEETGWWPGQVKDPAFETRRPEYGAVPGGDYVRGSEAKLPKAALRYPKSDKGTASAFGQGTLTARPYDYETIEIQWSIPPGLLGQSRQYGAAGSQTTWQEVSIVRSVYGAPSTVNDGVTVFRKLPKELGPLEYEEGSPVTLPVYDCNDPLDKGGKPGLVPGRWYYYSIFFRANPTEWVRTMTTMALLPPDWQHSRYLWEHLPPYYQLLDDNMAPESGPLRRFLKVFGFELDTTREFVEQMLMTYHVDASCMRLLRRVGENMGQPYEPELGDIRYRALIADLGPLYEIRGTRSCITRLCEAVTKYQCAISGSTNLMLLPDDSDFYGTGINAADGTGSWAGLHPDCDSDVVTGTTVDIAPPDKVVLTANLVGTVAPPEEDTGRGTMKMVTYEDEEEMPVVITCGCGITSQGRELTPLQTGIPIQPDRRYGFTIQIMSQIPQSIRVMMLWFSTKGRPTDMVGMSASAFDMSILDRWHTWTVQAQPPANAVYLVPAVHFEDRPPNGGTEYSIRVDFAGAQVYDLGDIDVPITTTPPDRYLTLGDPAEKIGPPKTGFDGYLMGEP